MLSIRPVVVSYRNSTSNHNIWIFFSFGEIVVSYRNSTSNHNFWAIPILLLLVVSYRNSTSNHNYAAFRSNFYRLYLIEILHQTTTLLQLTLPLLRCILSKFYIKPQHTEARSFVRERCILSKFYIKPQPGSIIPGALHVVSYRNSTSNHNYSARRPTEVMVVSYRNSTSNHNADTREKNLRHVVSYRNSTSNHNDTTCNAPGIMLYLIEILHQTTTLLPPS